MKIRDRIKELRRVKASELRPNPRNWRSHPQAQQDALRGVLAEVGYADVLLTRELEDGSLELIDGHLRAETTPDAEVLVLVLDVDEREAGLILATLDPLAAMAEADTDALGKLLGEIDTQSEAVRAMLNGIGDDYGLDIGGNGEVVEDDPPIDRAEELQEKWKVERGQLWKIGDHRLLCGDSTVAADVERVMGGEVAELLFTSPPYMNVREYGGHDMSSERLVLFLKTWSGFCEIQAVNLGIIRKDSEIVPYWNEYIKAANENDLKLLSWNVWDRQQPWSMAQNTAMFPIEHEWVFVFGTKLKQLNLTIENKTPGNRTGVTNRQADGALERVKTKKVHTHRPLGTLFRSPPHIGKDCGHPAMYPVALPTAYIEALTTAGGIICDPFLGSGTTMVAAEQLNRRCYGIEIAEKYCAVILERMTGQGCKCELETNA